MVTDTQTESSPTALAERLQRAMNQNDIEALARQTQAGIAMDTHERRDYVG